ncbi:dihydroorotate dehydrogenase B (NAD(+)), electron transfer subunit [Erysipelotrichaceae bacterium]|nr:dihydroorotate dehydrogenase B (NAD(+)), electron transfer subunit [Erysipelotrichaceae bacterium]
MIRKKLKIIQNIKLTAEVYCCVLEGDIVQEIQNPGQFLQIKIRNSYLRRPISISSFDKNKNQLTIIYKVLGTGTAQLASYQATEYLDVLGPLGNGFDITTLKNDDHILICGGGVGIPPLYGVLQAIKASFPQIHITVVLGFRTQAEIFLYDAFQALTPTHITTDDGSFGYAGNVFAAIPKAAHFDAIFACGPAPLLQGIEQTFKTSTLQLSYEEHMACGIGICMGCIKSTNNAKGYIRLCKEGPVLLHNPREEQ